MPNLNPFQVLVSGLTPRSSLGLGLGVFHSLSPLGRLSIPFINSGVRQGLSIRQIQGSLTKAGLPVNFRETSALARAARGAYHAAAAQNALTGGALYTPSDYILGKVSAEEFTRGSLVPPPAQFATLGYIQERNYNYTLKLDVVLNETGARSTEYVTIGTDKLLSNNELSDALDNILNAGVTTYNFRLQGASVDTISIDARLYTP